MLTATTVVTPARFEQGLTYADFLANAKVNRDKFEHNYNNPALTQEDLLFFRKASQRPEGPRKLLAIAEAWCGDVYRELPTAVRIAQAAEMELRIFLRDENPDIMDEFLSNEGKSRALPGGRLIPASGCSWRSRFEVPAFHSLPARPGHKGRRESPDHRRE